MGFSLEKIYETKFRKAMIADSIIDEEIKQVEKTGLNCYKYAFISRSGFKCKQKDNLILIKLEDLFKWYIILVYNFKARILFIV